LNQNKHLDFIGRLGSGLDIVDLKAAARIGIEIINSPEGNANAVAEHVLGMLLCLMNNIHLANAEVKAFNWNREPNRGSELEGKVLGIIGFGHTGTALARKLKNWGVKIITYDKYKTNIENDYPYVQQVSLSQLQDEAEIISIHLPLTEETDQMIDDSFFEKCKQGIIFINSSRGQIVNTKALLQALNVKKVTGACIDVLENEKFDTLSEEEKTIYGKIFDHKRTIMTPHIAGWTQESLVKIAEYLLFKLRNFYNM
jgi:D-3-phosphoglycerate dehydrogenase